jgi:hypothetical protein
MGLMGWIDVARRFAMFWMVHHGLNPHPKLRQSQKSSLKSVSRTYLKFNFCKRVWAAASDAPTCFFQSDIKVVEAPLAAALFSNLR